VSAIALTELKIVSIYLCIMITSGNFEVSSGDDENDTMRISRQGNKVRITVTLNCTAFIDKDTNQHVVYTPSLELTGYGETRAKAFEMLKESIDDYNQMLAQLTPKLLKAELTKLGWKQDYMRHKEYSKAIVDTDGQLQNFNAVDNTIKRVSVLA
jgi:hypothetical protein